ncbi:GntR family transcriptional regulator [Neolewinella antarctica]|uniref:DNA-binding transcriptional regulator YhcF (GntR family) n=1 Tax=Neolewinella antarctica TaxID=442734 RepID=A0ABX0XGK7_9BACT|nr:GntR family transcriptional regulator [Neolewinella antarctica]NJC28332.1 DNA-binding transcriptional regulator YhcF (GntR family) [Neolewinella antarctica]
MELLDKITIDRHAPQPKYRQLVDSISENISVGNFQLNAKLPSINKLSEQFMLSRDTVEKAYKVLKDKRIIISVKGKGFYISSTPLDSQLKVLFLLNKLSAYKMRMYHSFLAAVGPEFHVDLQVYHCDEGLFLDILKKNQKTYDHYVIMPHFANARQRHTSATEPVLNAMRRIPDNKLIILDNYLEALAENHAGVYQDFENDLYEALKMSREKIARYQKFVITFPSRSVYPYPKRIVRGFNRFCVEAKIQFQVIEEIEEHMTLEPGTLYLTIPETDLVNLVKAARDQGFTLGEDIGVISYNETPLKDLLGITTVSTDFDEMGRLAADLLRQRGKEKTKNRFVFTDRNSH